LGLALLVTGCGAGGSSTPASAPGPTETLTRTTVPAPRTLTAADDGGHFTLAVGATSAIVLSDPAAPEPVVRGTSVALVPVVNVADSGQREWEVRGVSTGVSTVTGGVFATSVTLTVP